MQSAQRSAPRWLNVGLAVAAVTLALIAALLLGPSSNSATAQSRVITAQLGVVQSTVSGSGNVQPASQLNLGFATSGVVSKIYIAQGQQVSAGQLLAELDPKAAEAALEQSRATLRSAEAALAQLEETGGETRSGTGSAAGTHTSASAASADKHPVPGASSAAPAAQAASPSATNTSTAAAQAETAKQSAATKEANLASARASVKSDALAVQSDEQALASTKLYAPQSGTIVSLSGEVGEAVSATGTSKAASTSSSSSSGATGASAAAGSGASGSRSTASSASSGSAPAFAVLSDLSSLQLVVPLSESEVVHVHPGQPATVTVEALEGRKLASQVQSVATLATSNSGVVSYDVTFQLEQPAAGLKPGMSATAEVVVHEEEGVNVPTSAISGGTVTVVQGAKRSIRRVVTGLEGTSATIILSGLKAGEQVALPLPAGGAASLSSRLAGRAGGALGGGALGGGGAFLLGRGLGAGGAGRGGGG